MSTLFNSPKKKKNNSKYQPAAIIPMSVQDNDHNEHHHNIRREKDKMSLTSKSKRKKQSTNKKSYVMISTSFDDGDYEIDDEDEEEVEEYEDEAGQTLNAEREHTLATNYNGSTISTSQIEAEPNEDDEDNMEDNMEDIQLSPMNDNDVLFGHNNGNNHHESTLIDDDKDGRNGKKNKYGLSAYYGLRLDYDGKSKCHDLGWAILWILHLIAMIVVLIVVWTSEHVSMPHATNGVFILCFLLAFAVIYAFLWTFLLRYCGGFIVWVLILGNLIFICAFASFCFIVGDRFRGIGVIFSILFIGFAIFTLLIGKKISYTIALLQLGSSILVTNPSALFVGFGVLIVQIIWLLIWGSIIVAWTAQYYHTDSSSDFGGILLIFILSFIWNHQVIKNIGHTTICAVISHWYFLGANCRPYPTLHALLRCLSTSLGSIAFGSLFINILQGLRAYLRVIRDEGFGCCSCCKYVLTCCLTGCDGLLQHFNTYAFVHVALYNTAYLKSGKNTFDLLSIGTERIYQLMNSCFIEYALLCGSICGGIINAILASWIANLMQFSTDWVVLFTCGGFLIGMSLSSVLLNAVNSAVICLMVLYAEEPRVLNELHPEQALRFDGAKKGVA